MTILKEKYLDVSELSPPEPMVIILSALSKLAENYYLKVKHSRVPYPLLVHLKENNWCYQYFSESLQGITLYIYKVECEKELNNIITHSTDRCINERS